MNRSKNTLMIMSEYEKERLKPLLENSIKIEKDDLHTLYVVDPQTMQKIVAMEKEFKQKLKKAKIKPPAKPYYHVAKLINPEPEQVAVYYNLTETKRYIYVKDKDSILRNIDKEFEIWKRSELKRAKEECKKQEEDFCQKIMKKTKEQIEVAEKKKEWLKNNINIVDVLWTTFDNAKKYLAVYYKDKKGKYHIEHLRRGIPNILQHEPSEAEKKLKLVEEFLASSDRAFGNFYYKKLPSKEE